MKKILITLLITLFCGSLSFANSEPTTKKPVDKNELTVQKPVLNNEQLSENITMCVIKCSITDNGITYEASAGNWYTGCKKAGDECLRRLAELTANPEP